MILTVTLNPAWDVTYRVDQVQPGHSHRVADVAGHAGGKGVNVSRVLHSMGIATLATGAVGGSSGTAIAEDLRHHGVPAAMFTLAGQSRRTTTITDRSGAATVFNEPGPTADRQCWPAFCAHLHTLLPAAGLVVLAGSLPPWAPVDGYAELTRQVRQAGLDCLVDADGAALAAALQAGPALVKPNRHELHASTGQSDLAAGAAAVLAAGARRVVVSDGPAGLYGYQPGSGWHAQPPPLAARNPTGAGDAAVAALAVGLLNADSWPSTLRRATAWSAAAVLHPQAGLLDTAAVEALSSRTRIRELSEPLLPETTC